jgi:glutaredoxin 3
MKPVTIYTKFLCPYCYRAKALLTARGATFTEHDISFDRPRRDEMLARSNGRTTVPQVFIGDLHVGGSDELAALDRAGELEALLA